MAGSLRGFRLKSAPEDVLVPICFAGVRNEVPPRWMAKRCRRDGWRTSKKAGTGDGKVAPLESLSKIQTEMPSMTLTVAHISPILSIIAGLLILIMPRLLNFVVAIFLIINGLIGLGLFRWLHLHP
jgi:hypothetical protein